MTAADRNTTADAHHALVEAGYEPTWATVALRAMAEAGYDVVARTPDTPEPSVRQQAETLAARCTDEQLVILRNLWADEMDRRKGTPTPPPTANRRTP